MPAATNVTPLPPYELASSDNGAGSFADVHAVDARIGRMSASDRDHLLERLHRLRTVLPVFAQELASSRRQAAALRIENHGLVDEVRRLRAQRGDSFR